MKIMAKIFAALIVLLAIPAVVSLGVMALWNGLITTVCGFAVITYWQAVGMFLLGQLLSGGFIFAIFGGFWSLHALFHRRRDFHAHWHNMTDEQRMEFIRRRREHFGFHHNSHKGEDAAD